MRPLGMRVATDMSWSRPSCTRLSPTLGFFVSIVIMTLVTLLFFGTGVIDKAFVSHVSYFVLLSQLVNTAVVYFL